MDDSQTEEVRDLIIATQRSLARLRKSANDDRLEEAADHLLKVRYLLEAYAYEL